MNINQFPCVYHWVIVGAETGNRKGKVTPKREWIDEITEHCKCLGIPVFYKSSVRELFPDLPESRFPWKEEKRETVW